MTANDAAPPPARGKPCPVLEAARQRARAQLIRYRLDAERHVHHWMRGHPRSAGESRPAYLARWQDAWNESEASAHANQALAPTLADYVAAARAALRMALKGDPADPIAAVLGKVAEMRGTAAAVTWEDQVLNKMLEDTAAPLVEVPGGPAPRARKRHAVTP
jgi:hypothetical protein